MSDLALIAHGPGRYIGLRGKLWNALLLVSVFLPLPGARAQMPADSVACGNPALRAELLEMGKIDQEVRKFFWGGQGQMPDSATLKRMLTVDSVNTERLKEIVGQGGWPGFSRVGQDGAESAFLILQHTQDSAFQERMLPLLRKAWEQSEITGQNLALLTDRVLVHAGKPQLYGSHFDILDGQVVFRAIEDSVHVDERRAAMGLLPLQKYKEFVEEASGLKNHGIFNEQPEEKK
ncbi:hypothetical protein LLH00_15370 [bacterium]|nr:hypothetical protein [bacterium]